MADPFDSLTKTLRQSGYSQTEVRRTVFEALHGHEPMTMRELVAACAQVDRASTYRTTELFRKLGIIQRLQIGRKYKLELTDRFSHHHHHMSCTNCGKIIPLPEDKALESRLTLLAKSQSFTPKDHQIEIRGLCSNCGE